MFDTFAHFLSYGSTDQQTVRALSEYFDGLLVPGTIAAFQAEGTKGFVLSLSARSQDPYVIDSRFPLFQNRLENPKKSHRMLADVLGAPELVSSDRQPMPPDFSAEVIRNIARKWIDFNLGFDEVKSKTFEKYASRLKEEVLPEDRELPAYILPPYTMVRALDDGWAEVSQEIWNASVEYAQDKGVVPKLRRVVAAGSPEVWDELAASSGATELVAWVSNLDEFRMESEARLLEYGAALQRSKARSQKVFALYGGFFSILLARHGLVGASHGIGFGEHRDWVELPSSGAPPARYYVPKLHRYVSVDIAVEIWRQFPELVVCDCSDCESGSPAGLDYHALMRHSVRARSLEIRDWVDKPTEEVVEQLEADFLSFRVAIAKLVAPSRVLQRAQEVYSHLAMWARVIRSLG